MFAISQLVNHFIFWGMLFEELSSRCERGQTYWLTRGIHVDANPKWRARFLYHFWVWIEEKFVRLFFDGQNHTENALANAKYDTYKYKWYNPVRSAGPIALYINIAHLLGVF